MLLRKAEEAAASAGFTRYEMGSTLAGLELYTGKGYRAVKRVAVPVGSGHSITVVHMMKDLPQQMGASKSTGGPSCSSIC